MSASLEADRAQRAAADPGASAFVVANAGSGKTKVLIDRVARLLLAGSDPSSILCITYTKAAAAEMQRRLYERLGAWSIADDKKLQMQLEALGEADARSPRALSQARRQFARALETPGGLRIQTIHAFCERLLARFPLEAGAPPGFQILDDAGQARLLEQARSRAAQQPALAEALERLCENIPGEAFEQLLGGLQAKGTDLAAAMAEGSEAAWGRIWRRHGSPPESALLEARVLDGAPWAAIIDAMGILSAEGGANNQKCAARFREALAAPSDWQTYRTAFFKDDGEPHGVKPTKKVIAAHPWLQDMIDGEVQRLSGIFGQLAARNLADDSFAGLLLGEAVAREYAQLKEAAGALDFNDLIAKARVLLCDRPAAAWVLYKLDGGIDHILLDEGQDTSPEQWALLRPLQEEFFAGEGARSETLRTMFAVGDPKQSIYSFQGADPRQFLNENQALVARAAGAERPFVGPRLEVSFRSTPQILDLVDAAIRGEEFAREGEPGIFDLVRHRAHRAEHGGLVQWWPVAPRAEVSPASPWDAPLDQEDPSASAVRLGTAIASTVAAWLREGDGVWEKDTLRPMHPGDVLVLVKKRGPVFRAVLRALKREGLPVAGADRMVLKEELAVQDLLALARVALDPNDDLALACVLKSPLLGLLDDDQDLFPLAYGRSRNEPLIARLRADATPRFDAARRLIERAAMLRDATPFRFFSSALEGFGAPEESGWKRMSERLGPEARDPLEELLNQAMQAPRDGVHSLWGFLAAMEKAGGSIKRDGEDAGRTIRLMTVHGAKGLEAPIVFLAETNFPPGDGARDGLFFDGPDPLWSASKKYDDPVAGGLRAARELADRQEHQRLLYVALTRARDRLIICAAAHGRSAQSHEAGWHAATERAMRQLPQAHTIETPFGGGLQLGARSFAEGPRAFAAGNLDLTPPWINRPAPPPEAVPPPPRRGGFSPHGNEAQRFRRGLLIHGLLQRLPDVAHARRREAGLGWLLRSGVEHEAASLLLAEALGVLDHPDCAPVFGPGSRAEQPILGEGARGVIDRLLISPSAIWVVDFKTDRPAPEDWRAVDPAYVAQLGGYARALREAFPGRQVRTSLIWTEAPRVMALPEEAWTTASRARVD